MSLCHCLVVSGAVIWQCRVQTNILKLFFGFSLTSFWWKKRSKQKLLLERFEYFFTQNPIKHQPRGFLPTAPLQCTRTHGGDVKLMAHRQEDTCRLLQKWHVKCAGQDVDARDGEGLPLLQTPCGGWKNTLVDVTPCYSIHLPSLPAPSLCTPLKQHLWPRRDERDIGSGVCWGTLFLPSTPTPSSRIKLFLLYIKGGHFCLSRLFSSCLYLLHMEPWGCSPAAWP